MLTRDYRARLEDLKTTSGINQRYHQRLSWRWSICDRATRIVVALCAVAAITLAVMGEDCRISSLVVSSVSVVIAIILNVVPFGDHQRLYSDMFSRWSELRKDVEVLLVKAGAMDEAKSPPKYVLERLEEVTAKEHTLHAAEPAPWVGLLDKCQGDEIESQWGRGIRTSEQAEEERTRRLQPRVGVTSPEGPSSEEGEED